MTKKLLLIVLLFFSCNRTTVNHKSIIESKVIELSFDPFNISEYTEKKYFYIDDITVTHDKNYLNKIEDSTKIYLPSFNYIVARAGEKIILEKTNIFELSFILGKKLIDKNKNYRIVNQKELNAGGNLIIERIDQKNIKLVIPEEYEILASKVK